MLALGVPGYGEMTAVPSGTTVTPDPARGDPVHSPTSPSSSHTSHSRARARATVLGTQASADPALAATGGLNVRLALLRRWPRCWPVPCSLRLAHRPEGPAPVSASSLVLALRRPGAARRSGRPRVGRCRRRRVPDQQGRHRRGVNFGSLGGGHAGQLLHGATSSTTGLTALHEAGFNTDGTVHDGPGFVCRIDDKPGNPPEDCNADTPPASAYWSYWQATNGGSWVYSSQGAATKHVHVGGFEGWSFGNGSAKPTSSNPSRPVQPTFRIGPAASTTTHRSSSSSTSPTSKPTATKRSPTSTATSTSSDSATALAAGPTGTAGAQLPDEGQGSGGHRGRSCSAR